MLKKPKKIISYLIALAMLISIISVPMAVYASTWPVSLSVSNASGAAGSNVTISLNISADSGLGAGAFWIEYDTTKLTYVSSTKGTAGLSGNTEINPNYSTNGNLRKINDSFINGDGLTIGGALMTVTFTILSGWTGSTPLTLTVGDFYDATNWEEIPFAANSPQSGSISVAALTSNITFNANGGTGGWGPTAMTIGSPLTAPAVTRLGYTFTGWQPSPVPATVPGTDTTYTAQWVATPLAVTVTKSGSNMIINIQGCTADSKYQIWSYQKITSDYLIDVSTNIQANQWILSQAYTAGSAGAIQLDGSIEYTVPSFISPDENYTVAVRVIDAGNNFVAEKRDSFTPLDVSEVVITKTLVDGQFSTGYEVKSISAGTVLIKVIGNGVPGTSYSAMIAETSTSLTASGTNLDEFIWNLSGMKNGIYTLVVGATNGVGGTSDSQEISFQLYESASGIDYGSIDSMNLTYSGGFINIEPNFTNGSFWYRISESGRTPINTLGLFTQLDTIQYQISQPGIYQVAGYVNRDGVVQIGNSYDDGIIKTIVVPRTGGVDPTTEPSTEPTTEPTTAPTTEPTTAPTTEPTTAPTTGPTTEPTTQPTTEPPVQAEMILNANTNLSNVPINTPVIFTATAGLTTSNLFSFWRLDASGWKLMKDWSSSSTLNWTPARIGGYTIQVRAKGPGAGSYEELTQRTVNVTGTSREQKVQLTDLAIVLNGTPHSRVPIVVTLNATGADKDTALYKLYVSDADLGSKLVGGFSPSSKFVWTPREPGTYTLTAVANSQASYGQGDFTSTYTVTVS